MRGTIGLGTTYFAIVFAVAFAVGIVRVTVVAPVVGAWVAVLIELPVIIATSWAVARHLLRHVVYDAGERAAIGLVAFVLLMVSECALAVLLFGKSAGDWAAELVSPLGLLGLAGQLVFAAMPLIVTRSSSRS